MFLFTVLKPSNIKAKLKIATMPSQQDYLQPVLDAKIDLEQIYLNINRDQVEKKNEFVFNALAILVFGSTRSPRISRFY